jgi:hypothetical protein
LAYGCSQQAPDASEIINNSIDFHGGELFENSIIDFDFRDRHYKIERNKGLFTYHRLFEDSLGKYHDILNNNGFKRFLNGSELKVEPEWARRYSNSINSVVYFALLPYGLNDPAVIKRYLGEEEIAGKRYYKIRVTFKQDGGGEDFNDVFVYWINKETYGMDFFGYAYESDGGGIRFRQAVNTRRIDGILFTDYINFKGADNSRDVAGLAALFQSGKLAKLSEISLENIEAAFPS